MSATNNLEQFREGYFQLMESVRSEIHKYLVGGILSPNPEIQEFAARNMTTNFVNNDLFYLDGMVTLKDLLNDSRVSVRKGALEALDLDRIDSEKLKLAVESVKGLNFSDLEGDRNIGTNIEKLIEKVSEIENEYKNPNVAKIVNFSKGLQSKISRLNENLRSVTSGVFKNFSGIMQSFQQRQEKKQKSLTSEFRLTPELVMEYASNASNITTSERQKVYEAVLKSENSLDAGTLAEAQEVFLKSTLEQINSLRSFQDELLTIYGEKNKMSREVKEIYSRLGEQMFENRNLLNALIENPLGGQEGWNASLKVLENYEPKPYYLTALLNTSARDKVYAELESREDILSRSMALRQLKDFMDIQKLPEKAEKLMEVCREAGGSEAKDKLFEVFESPYCPAELRSQIAVDFIKEFEKTQQIKIAEEVLSKGKDKVFPKEIQYAVIRQMIEVQPEWLVSESNLSRIVKDREMALMLAQSESCLPEKVVEALAQSNYLDVRLSVMRNPVYSEMLYQNKEIVMSFLNSPNEVVALTAAVRVKDPKLMAEFLDSGRASESVKVAFARNLHCDKEVVDRLLDSKEKNVVLETVKNQFDKIDVIRLGQILEESSKFPRLHAQIKEVIASGVYGVYKQGNQNQRQQEGYTR